MAEGREMESPLEIETVEHSMSGENVLVRMNGRWLDRRHSASEEVTLVIESQGRRYEFPATPPPRFARIVRSESCSATFAVPGWLAPLVEQSTLTVGEAVVPLRTRAEKEDPMTEEQPVDDGPPSEPVVDELPSEPVADEPPSAPGAAPMTLGALRDELQDRAAEAASLRGALADSRAREQALRATEQRLERTLAELRREQGELRSLAEQVAGARSDADRLEAELAVARADADRLAEESAVAREDAERLAGELARARDELGVSEASRDAAQTEVSGLRAEIERLGSELGGVRAGQADEDPSLSEAAAMLAEARALRAALLGETGETPHDDAAIEESPTS